MATTDSRVIERSTECRTWSGRPPLEYVFSSPSATIIMTDPFRRALRPIPQWRPWAEPITIIAPH